MKEIRYRLTAWGNWAGTRVGTEYPVSSWPVPMASSDIAKRHKNSYIICSENKVLMSH